MVKLEIERKFIIRKPLFLQQLECVYMEQTYLISAQGTRRVRMVQQGDEKKFYFTHKIRHSALTAREQEEQISPQQYKTLLLEADPQRNTIFKRRYYYPYKEHIFEIDEYPFWQRQCVMEVEMEREDTPVAFPPEIQIICEVTEDKRYKNVSLAQQVPQEMI